MTQNFKKIISSCILVVFRFSLAEILNEMLVLCTCMPPPFPTFSAHPFFNLVQILPYHLFSTFSALYPVFSLFSPFLPHSFLFISLFLIPSHSLISLYPFFSLSVSHSLSSPVCSFLLYPPIHLPFLILALSLSLIHI